MLIFIILFWSFSVQLEQGTVTSLLEENGTVKGVQYKTKSGEERKAYAPLTIVCDGCFSNLRRALCSPKVALHIILIAGFCGPSILMNICS
jgi:2-polyprenyl-6-methoxyphenol hydroxylase-like FAD-dependent oxidoreductase